ncbi:MAG: hypothetical protein IJT84_05560 [Clostridia bacterium]|nr:hypothetical protein [Clostridia bacterium]
MKERMATFTVQVPVKFIFRANSKTDCDDLIKKAIKEADKRLLCADVDYKESDVEVIKKTVDVSAEDIRAENEFWAKVLGAKI